MDGRKVWQVSAGPASRSYADVLLKHGVALIGPGDAGAWRPERDDSAFDGSFVRRWVPELARVPTAAVHAPWALSPLEQQAAGCRIGHDYPAPIVDHGAARARMLAAYARALDGGKWEG